MHTVDVGAGKRFRGIGVVGGGECVGGFVVHEAFIELGKPCSHALDLGPFEVRACPAILLFLRVEIGAADTLWAGFYVGYGYVVPSVTLGLHITTPVF